MSRFNRSDFSLSELLMVIKTDSLGDLGLLRMERRELQGDL